MAMKAKHAFGNSSSIEAAKQANKIDNFDILFLDGETDPKIGWIDGQGNTVIVPNKTDLSGVEAELATKANAEDVEMLESQIATKANTEEVEAKISEASQSSVDAAKAYTDKMVDAAMGEHLTKKYEITDVPEGTLVDYRESEIRIFCPESVAWKKQAVGANGDPNSYYCTLKTYFPDGAVGYIEHLGDQVDNEILTDVKTDAYGRRYQPTWLALAKYNESTNTWTYHGASSTSDKMIGWNYRIDFYDTDGVMIASDGIRISLSNEGCHYSIEPYYVGKIMKDVDTIIEEKIAEVEASYEVIEF